MDKSLAHNPVAAVAQAVVNIDAGHDTIEHGSQVYRGMVALCAVVTEWQRTADVLPVIEALADGNAAERATARLLRIIDQQWSTP